MTEINYDADALAASLRRQNDAFRAAEDLIGPRIAKGEVVITPGLAALGTEFVDRALAAVRDFDDFTEDNDPYGEHDFGIIELDGRTIDWKIDYYDR